MQIEKEKTFIRQTTLPEIGQGGQEKMLNARIAIVGCGGLGSTAAVYLAASGIGHIHLIDYDKIDLSNLHRQVFYQRDQVGQSKSKTLASYIKKISPYVHITFQEKPITKSNISEHLNSFPLVVDCTDSLATKYLLNDYCVLNEKALVYGSLYKHDGYVAVFNVKTHHTFSANLRDAFPTMPQKHIPNCSEIGTLNPIVGIIGLMQGNEVIKLVTGAGEILKDKILIYNSMENSQFSMKLEQNFPVDKIRAIYREDAYFDARCEVQDDLLLIKADQLMKKLDKNEVKIISVIEDLSLELPFKVDLQIPLSKFNASALESYQNDELVIICQRGISSYTATIQLKKEFPLTTVYSLQDGINNLEKLD